jgi:hypothetical protein
MQKPSLYTQASAVLSSNHFFASVGQQKISRAMSTVKRMKLHFVKMDGKFVRIKS